MKHIHNLHNEWYLVMFGQTLSLTEFQYHLQVEFPYNQNKNIFQEEYEAARTELLEEIGRGTSVEELQSKLTKKPDAGDVKSDTVENLKVGIPDDLVQVQAYIRWERAGKPNFPPDKQLVCVFPCNLIICLFPVTCYHI